MGLRNSAGPYGDLLAIRASIYLNRTYPVVHGRLGFVAGSLAPAHSNTEGSVFNNGSAKGVRFEENINQPLQP